MVARLHTDGDPWPRIIKRVRGSKGKIVAAVAYLGQDAPQILPRRKRDVPVCDAFSHITVTACSFSDTRYMAVKPLLAKGFMECPQFAVDI